MTEFSIPPLVIDYGGWWIDVNLDEDPHTWAQQTAPKVLARWGKHGRRLEKQLTSLLDAAARASQKTRDATGVFLLYPELGKDIRAFVRLVPVDLSGHDEDSSWTALLASLTPVEGDGLSLDEPEIIDLPTPAGACKRLRFLQAGNDGNAVGEHLQYLWVFPQYGSGAVLATWFDDLAEAGRWRPALDELAASVTLDQSAG
jgi:hypothetical protein